MAASRLRSSPTRYTILAFLPLAAGLKSNQFGIRGTLMSEGGSSGTLCATVSLVAGWCASRRPSTTRSVITSKPRAQARASATVQALAFTMRRPTSSGLASTRPPHRARLKTGRVEGDTRASSSRRPLDSSRSRRPRRQARANTHHATPSLTVVPRSLPLSDLGVRSGPTIRYISTGKVCMGTCMCTRACAHRACFRCARDDA
mmetsp:Transcript_31492/g.62915  ORF Transcript_31492/g.62915 Transcript_31492/m.62915 type:complete len:203 (+) Transcript_31492:665-1273(+)